MLCDTVRLNCKSISWDLDHKNWNWKGVAYKLDIGDLIAAVWKEMRILHADKCAQSIGRR